MKISKVVLLVSLLPVLADTVAPFVAGFLVSLSISLITMVVKTGLEGLINYGLSVARKKDEQRLQEIARKASERNELNDEEKENLIKGILMREMIHKIYHVDYNCTWNTRSSEVELSFFFSYPQGHDIIPTTEKIHT